jgi:uncharacterized protein
MKIVVDITHFPHLNFFKNAIQKFLRDGLEVDIVVQNRGNLTSILEFEYKLPYKKIGDYSPSALGKMASIFTRDVSLFTYLRTIKYDAATGVGSINLAHVSFLLRKPTVIFEDDIEYKLAFYPYRYFASFIVVPDSIPLHGPNVLRYRGFKELAYLHPKYFTPTDSVLKDYGLKPSRYIFMRDVTRTTLNYAGLSEGILSRLCPTLREMGYDVVVSLEDKKFGDLYGDSCIVLQEPTPNIHSLLHYAALTVASGDSMARESCLVGTPVIYTGQREMVIHEELKKMGCFFQADRFDDIIPCVNHIIEKEIKKKTVTAVDHAMKTRWDDVTGVITDIMEGLVSHDENRFAQYRDGGR